MDPIALEDLGDDWLRGLWPSEHAFVFWGPPEGLVELGLGYGGMGCPFLARSSRTWYARNWGFEDSEFRGLVGFTAV